MSTAKTVLALVLALAALATLSACATRPPELDAFHEPYVVMARSAEKHDNLPEAIKYWRIVRAADPTNRQAFDKVVELEKKAAVKAESLYKQGLRHMGRGRVNKARHAMLSALYYNPDHALARDYLRHKITARDYRVHIVKPGDTLRKIAAKYYPDDKMYLAIEYLSDLKDRDIIRVGQSLRVPVFEIRPEDRKGPVNEQVVEFVAEVAGDEETDGSSVAYGDAAAQKQKARPSAPAKTPEAARAVARADTPAPEPATAKKSLVDEKEAITGRLLAEADQSLAKDDYRQTAAISEQVLRLDPQSGRARELKNESYHAMGESLVADQEYREALAVLNHVDPSYKDTSHLLGRARTNLAEMHYKKGVLYFTEEELDMAAEEWQQALEYDPDHANASRDLERVRELQKRINRIK
jgi:tetratricopeptide (TPR) repeat protein